MIGVSYSSLKNGCISKKDGHINEGDYLCAGNVQNEIKVKPLSDYYDLYLKTDVLLLTDIFEKFINQSLKCYGLDPCHYFSSPQLSWDAMLKMTRIELELTSDIEMHLFIAKGMKKKYFFHCQKIQ